MWTQRPAMEMIQNFSGRLTGADGKVYAFDIQKAAVEHTKKRLEEAGLTERAKVILDGHEHMENYVRETVSAITFNFGYLPGGDHQIATQADTSIQAIEGRASPAEKRRDHEPLYL